MCLILALVTSQTSVRNFRTVASLRCGKTRRTCTGAGQFYTARDQPDIRERKACTLCVPQALYAAQDHLLCNRTSAKVMPARPPRLFFSIVACRARSSLAMCATSRCSSISIANLGHSEFFCHLTLQRLSEMQAKTWRVW